MGFLILQMKKSPFYDKKLNDLETTSLLVHIAIIYFGLYYQAGKKDAFVLSSGTTYTMFILVCIVSLLFIGIFIVRMRLEIMKATVMRHSFCFRIFSCGRVRDKEEFKKEHKIG